MVIWLAALIASAPPGRAAAAGIIWQVSLNGSMTTVIEGDIVTLTDTFIAGVAAEASSGSDYDALDMPKPVTPPAEYLDMRSSIGTFPNVGYYQRDIRIPAASLSWKVKVDTDLTGEVTLTWDLSTLPSGYDISLEDLTTSTIVNMQTSSSYAFSLDGETRNFRLTISSTPVLLSPANGAGIFDASPDLDWSDISEISGVTYSLQIDEESNFSSPVVIKTGLDFSEYTLSLLESLAEGAYYWQAKAADGAGGFSNWTTAWSFTLGTTALAVPTLLSPADGAKSNDTTPTLDWSDVSDPSGITYSVHIDDSPDFSSPMLSRTGLTASDYTVTVGEALSPSTYHWRIRATNGQGNHSAWSGGYSLIVDTTSPVSPTLSFPANSSRTSDTTPAFDWSDVTDPSGTTYNLQIDDGSDFASPVLAKMGLGTSDYTPNDGEALTQGTYYWRVRAVDGATNQSAWSGAWFFILDVTAPDTPVLSSPPTGTYTNDTTPSLDWSDVSDPSGITYSLQVDDSSDFSSPRLITELTTSGYTPSAGEALTQGTYYWRAMATDRTGLPGGWSESRSFTIDTAPPTVALSPLTPDPISDDTPTFTGRVTDLVSPARAQYQIDGSSWLDAQAVDGAFDELAEDYTFTTTALTQGAHTARARATDAAGNTVSEANYASDAFTIDTTPPQIIITPLSPDPTKNNTPTFLGTTGDTVAAISEVQYRVDEGDWQEAQATDGAFDEREEDYTFTLSPLGDGLHFVEVKASDAPGNIIPEAAWAGDTFTTDTIAPLAPGFSFPAKSQPINDVTPAIDWQDVSDPSGVRYDFQLDNDADFASPLVARESLTSSEDTLQESEALPEGTYYGRVLAIDGVNNDSPWSEEWFFIIDTTPPGKPSLLLPTSGSQTYYTAPPLDWLSVTDPSGVTYTVQIDHNSDFAAPVFNREGIASSEYALLPEEALAENTHYWRVRATDGATNASEWSQDWSFTPIPLPSCISPATGEAPPGCAPVASGGLLSSATFNMSLPLFVPLALRGARWAAKARRKNEGK